MKLPFRLRPAPGQNLPPLPPARPRTLVSLLDIVPQIATGVELGLTQSVPQESEAVAPVPDLPVVGPQVLERFHVVQGAAGPEAGDTASGGDFERGAAGLGPDCAGHEVGGVGEEVGDGGGGGAEGVDAFRLVAVDEFEDMVNLSLCGDRGYVV